jgi:hypothetical protein
LAIQQKLADANPAVTGFQRDLAMSHVYIGLVLARTGKSEEALTYLEERLQRMKAKHGPDYPATLATLDGAALIYLAIAAQQAWLGQEQEWAATCERGLSLAKDTAGDGDRHHPQRNQGWEVKRRNANHHTQRFADGVAVDIPRNVGQRLSHQLGWNAAGKIDDIKPAPQRAARLAQQLAVFADDATCHVRELLFQQDCHAIREPLGVVVGIPPFNFPALIPL